MYPRVDVGLLSSVDHMVESPDQMALFYLCLSVCQLALHDSEVLSPPTAVILVPLWTTNF